MSSPAFSLRPAPNRTAAGAPGSASRRIVRGARVLGEAMVVPTAHPGGAGAHGRRGANGAPSLEPDPAEILNLARRQARRILDEATARAARLRAEAELVLAQAPDLVGEARREVEELRRALEVEAERARITARVAGHAEGYRVGYEQGQREGRAAVRAELGERLEQITQAARDATVTRRQIVQAAEADLAVLAVDVAEWIIRREISTDPTIVAGLVETAVTGSGLTGPVRIRVNPQDRDLIGEHWANAHEAEGDRFEFVVDERIRPGGVVIDVRSGSVDGQIETQLDEVRKAFAE